MGADLVRAGQSQFEDLGGGEVLGEAAVGVVADLVVVGGEQFDEFQRQSLALRRKATAGPRRTRRPSSMIYENEWTP